MKEGRGPRLIILRREKSNEGGWKMLARQCGEVWVMEQGSLGIMYGRRKGGRVQRTNQRKSDSDSSQGVIMLGRSDIAWVRVHTRSTRLVVPSLGGEIEEIRMVWTDQN